MRLVAPTALAAAVILVGCDGCRPDAGDGGPTPEASGTKADDPAPSLSGGPSPSASVAEPPPPRLVAKCPNGMTRITSPDDAASTFCIDRWEATVVDDASGTALSPYYPPAGKKARYLFDTWQKRTAEATEGTDLCKSMPLPQLPACQRAASLVPRAAEPKAGVVPAGYVSGEDAKIACERANKRLCTEPEWRRACRGEDDQDFPYGAEYEQGTCNVFREAHPGVLLYENPSINHTDPRFNKVTSKGKPLLRKTGATPKCASKWGDDAVFDMVGNLDEWVDDPEGTFVGGFYARAQKGGCQASVKAHGFDYADYSTGFRCCAKPELVAAD
jgi:sulfatase modifying factor 1